MHIYFKFSGIYCSQKWFLCRHGGEMIGWQLPDSLSPIHIEITEIVRVIKTSCQKKDFYKMLPSPLKNSLIFSYLFQPFIFSSVPPCNMCEMLSKAFWYYHKLLCKQTYCFSVKGRFSFSLAIFSISICVKGFSCLFLKNKKKEKKSSVPKRLWRLVSEYCRFLFAKQPCDRTKGKKNTVFYCFCSIRVCRQ